MRRSRMVIDTENVGKTWGFSERRRVPASEGGRKRQLTSEQIQLLIRWSGVSYPSPTRPALLVLQQQTNRMAGSAFLTKTAALSAISSSRYTVSLRSSAVRFSSSSRLSVAIVQVVAVMRRRELIRFLLPALGASAAGLLSGLYRSKRNRVEGRSPPP